MKPKTVYLAGPDVFRPDFAAIRERLKALCRAAGLAPLSPADGDPPACDPSELSRRIYLQNIEHIEHADIVMANLENFRGHEPDSGTVFEIGYAIGRGKQVFCYNVPTLSLIEQIPCDPARRDCDGNAVEDFGWSRNLMLVHACHFVNGDARDCIEAIGAHYRAVR
jgi:nucleoside 2-deoxyribosyltransferase